MSPVADITVPAEEFVLSEAVVDVADLRVTVEGIVTLPDAGVTPYLRADRGDLDAFEAALASDETAAGFDALWSGEGERHYRVEWANPSSSVLSVLDRAGGSITSAEFADRRWRLRVRFRNREALSAFCDRCRRECPVTLDRVFAISETDAFRESALSKQQHEALLKALEGGYFEVPRGVTQEELASELGISSQSVSQRLRRGQRNLLLNTIAAENSPGASPVGRDR